MVHFDVKTRTRNILIVLISILLAVAMMGCAGQKIGDIERKADEGQSEEPVVIQVVSEAEAPITGTWQMASMAYEDDGIMYPEYYVQFTNEEINYGHMKDGDFTVDHSDKISGYEEIAGGYRVHATGVSGVQYTYQTSDGDKNILEYYETWNENEFADKYSGGASLSRCE